MSERIRVIIKRPDEEYGHVTNISNTLGNLQRTVGGYIEVIQVAASTAVICNEEGKLLGLEPNMFIGGELLVGDLIFVGTDGEDFCDIPISFAAYKKLFFGE